MTGVVSQDTIDGWKKEHGEVFMIEDTAGSVCYLKKPNRVTLDAFFANSKNILKALEIFVKNCWLGGDESFKTDELKLMSVGEQIDSIIEVKKTTLKKL